MVDGEAVGQISDSGSAHARSRSTPLQSHGFDTIVFVVCLANATVHRVVLKMSALEIDFKVNHGCPYASHLENHIRCISEP